MSAPALSEREPRWPAVVALLVVGLLNLALPPHLTLGPRWLPLAIIALFLCPIGFAHVRDRQHLSQVLGHFISGLTTVFLGSSVILLVSTLPLHKENGSELLKSAGCIWLSNVINFALWYWRLDAGGPVERERVPGHASGDFLFPQMTLPKPSDAAPGEPSNYPWSPGFVDYLFLAFNTSTALSPTDVPVLSRWAKVLMMLQSSISLVVIAILASRAVNIM